MTLYHICFPYRHPSRIPPAAKILANSCQNPRYRDNLIDRAYLFVLFAKYAQYSNPLLREDEVMTPERKQLLAARAEVFKALGHPSRLSIVDALAQGERCVCELNESIDADMSTVSRHLAVLKNAGILSSEKRGNQVFYKLECPCITTFYGCVESVIHGAGKPVQLGVAK